ncbi:hypothetical protein Tsubulata_047928 [Turnera subulata]|uniref:Uncharacterized protein n=1 Tax=Turnera subulata TaxID=218843 RepID=A0A9Q0F6N8_9ROSI|nr:hypothetical protein Tsubulata_047928 [Turnera subulata]
MLSRAHERGCCLTYDTVTDEATDLLGDRDLDLISMLRGLLVSRPPHSSLSHKNALQKCIEHAKLWFSNSDSPIDPNAGVSCSKRMFLLSFLLSVDNRPKMRIEGGGRRGRRLGPLYAGLKSLLWNLGYEIRKISGEIFLKCGALEWS